MNRKFAPIALFAVAVLALGACSDPNNSGIKNDERLSEQALADLQRAHPTPKFKRSQLRQNLVELIRAQAETTQTTTFFFNQGVTDPIMSCPSIGFPIPSTAQLTNPDQKVNRHDLTLPQVEPTGIYTGDSTGTYVICIDAQGKAFASYWEGFVQTVTGPAEWNATAKRVTLVGPSSFEFSGS